MLITFERKIPQSSYTSQNDHKISRSAFTMQKSDKGALSIRLWNRPSKIILSSSSWHSSTRASWTISDHSPQILSMLIVALFSLMKTPLLICLSLNNWKTFFTLGDTCKIKFVSLANINNLESQSESSFCQKCGFSFHHSVNHMRQHCLLTSLSIVYLQWIWILALLGQGACKGGILNVST